MSYILDAIKKSEAERGHGSIPGLQTVHSSSLNYKTGDKQLWPYILIALLIINIVGLGFYFLNNTEKKPITAAKAGEIKPETVQKHTAPKNVQAQTTDPLPTKIEQIETTSEHQNIKPKVNNTERLISTKPNFSNEVANIDELPVHIRQRIPTMDFSGHVYSSTALQRSIIINGSFKEEGDSINHEITLTEITKSGAIFNFQGTLFKISVLTGWSIN